MIYKRLRGNEEIPEEYKGKNLEIVRRNVVLWGLRFSKAVLNARRKNLHWMKVKDSKRGTYIRLRQPQKAQAPKTSVLDAIEAS